MSLKDITKDLHHEAETTKFAKTLLSGNITKEQYANYLYQMLAIYDPLEFFCTRQGIFNRLPGLARNKEIYKDFLEIEDPEYHYVLLPSTLEYHIYLLNLGNDKKRSRLIKAHMYVRHMGDLFGGQVIKKQVPFTSHNFYNFENSEILKSKIREELDDSLGSEARVAFEYAIKIMKELHDGE
jgi:heme oxygenase